MEPRRLQIHEDTSQRYPGQVFYLKYEQAFNVHPERAIDVHILLGYLHLSFREERGIFRACRIVGYHSDAVWIKRSLQLPPFIVGDLILLNPQEDDDYIDRWVESGEWETFIDPATGWICFGDEHAGEQALAVEFASDLIAVVEEGDLKALWIKPLIVNTAPEERTRS